MGGLNHSRPKGLVGFFYFIFTFAPLAVAVCTNNSGFLRELDAVRARSQQLEMQVYFQWVIKRQRAAVRWMQEEEVAGNIMDGAVPPRPFVRRRARLDRVQFES